MSQNLGSIGARVRYWRRRRGQSQRVFAGLTGLSQGYVSQIESGLRIVDRRSTLIALADALQISVIELTGDRVNPTDPAKTLAASAIPAMREALIMREIGERDRTPITPGMFEALMTASAVGDIAGQASVLPIVVRSQTGPRFVEATYAAMFWLRYLGYSDLARDAARLGLQEARKLDDPVWLGVAEFTRTNSLPTETSGIAADLARRAAEELQPFAADPRVRQAYGMLHLTAALRAASARQAEVALAHLAEADIEAATLGEPDGLGLATLSFGPTNVGIWRMSAAKELGEPDEVLRVAEGLAPQRLGIRHRQAVFHIDRARALVSIGKGRDGEAVAAFLRAEHVAPQWVRLQPTVRDAIVVILNRSRRNAVSRPLRHLAVAFDLPA